MSSIKNALQVGDSVQALNQLGPSKHQLVYADLRIRHGTRGPLWGMEEGFQLPLFGHSSQRSNSMVVDLVASRIAQSGKTLVDLEGTLVFDVDLPMLSVVRRVLDEILSSRFRAQILITHGAEQSALQPTTLSALLIYSGSRTAIWERAYESLVKLDPPSAYRHTEERSGRIYALGDCVAAAASSSGFAYEWNGVRRRWKWPETRMTDLLAAGRLVHTRSGMPRIKRYLDEARREMSSVWKRRAPEGSRVLSQLLAHLAGDSRRVFGLGCTDATRCRMDAT